MRRLLIGLLMLCPFLSGAGLVGTAVSNAPAGGGANASQIWSMTWDQGIATSAATAYQLPFAPESGDLTADTTEANRRAPMPAAGVVSDLNCKLSGDLGAANDVLTFTIRKNAADTAVVCTITAAGGTEDSCNSGANTATFAAGDLISMSIVTADTPTAVLPSCYLLWTPTVADEFVLLGTRVGSASTPRYYTPVGHSTNTLTETARSIRAPVAGSITALYVKSDSTYTTTQTRTFDVMVAGAADTDAQCIIDSTGDATLCENTTGPVAITLGQTISLRDAAANTPPTDNVGFGMRFVPTNTGEFPLLSGNNGGASTAANRYFQLAAGLSTANGTEATMDALMPAFTAKRIYAEVTTAPTVTGWDFTLNDDTSATALTCNIAPAATTCETASDVSIGAGSMVVYLVDPGAGETTASGSISISIGATYP